MGIFGFFYDKGCFPISVNEGIINAGLPMDKIAFLIPCYNEETTIGKVVDDCHRFLPEAVVYVYDNNCTDRTGEIALTHGAILRHETKQGKGNVVRTMFREIDAECYLMVDGDDTYDLSTSQKMADLILQNGSDMVVGDRLSGAYYTQNKRPFHNFGNDLVRSRVNRIFHGNIKDIMTGYRAFSYAFVKTFPVLSQGFEIETEMTIQALDKNLHVETLTVGYQDRPAGSVSKLRTFRDGYRVLKTISHFFRDYRPMAYFGGICFILFALATGFIIPVFLDYFQTGQVAKIPTLVVCCFTYLAAFLAFFAGLLLQTLRKKDLQRFELDLQQAHYQLITLKNQTLK
jgi:glycosyltransferase involved in cell wall biosynthesis